MSWWLLLTLGVGLGTIVLATALFIVGHGFELAEFTATGVIVFGAIATLLLAGAGIIHAVEVTRSPTLCENWGERTGVETRWIQHGYWEWDCYVRAEGRWVPRSQVRVAVEPSEPPETGGTS